MLTILRVFSNTPFTVGQHGVNGLHYEALQDQLKWIGLSQKKYTNILLTTVNYYIKGLNNR